MLYPCKKVKIGLNTKTIVVVKIILVIFMCMIEVFACIGYTRMIPHFSPWTQLVSLAMESNIVD